MNSQQARALVTETFPQPFDKGRFRNFAINLLNHTGWMTLPRWGKSIPAVSPTWQEVVKALISLIHF